MNINNKDNLFLALIADTNFWDTSKLIVYLNQGCLPYQHDSCGTEHTERVVQSPWEKKEDVQRAYNYLNELYERHLTELSGFMNEIHGTEHNVRYWRVVIGPWLQLFLHVLYDRYSHIKAAIAEFEKFDTMVLAEDFYQLSENTHDFIEFCKDDKYSLQLYSKILHTLGFSFPQKEWNAIKVAETINRQSLKNCLFNWMASQLSNFLAIISSKAPIVITEAHFPKSVKIKLFLKFFGKLEISEKRLNYRKTNQINFDQRHIVNQKLSSNNEFEHIVSHLISFEIPKFFIEDFKAAEQEVDINYATNPKVIFCANGWYYNELFKLRAAAASEKGTILAGIQHGGNYGTEHQFLFRDHEIAICDYFYSWGWKGPEYKVKLLTMPPVKMIGKNSIKSRRQGQDILFVATNIPRHTLLLPFTSYSFSKYMNWQARFFQNLNLETRRQTLVRPHNEDCGWNLSQRLKDKFEGLAFDDWTITFLERLEGCRLFVVDHISTTFFEAMISNKPTILFMDEKYYPLKKAAVPIFRELTKAGIFHESPEAAAKAVLKIMPDVETWWQSSACQEARLTFCNNYAQISDNSEELWTNEIMSYLEKKND